MHKYRNIFPGEVPQLAAGGAYAMAYDADGRLTADESRGVTRVVYNPLGLPQRVTMDDCCYVTNDNRARVLDALTGRFTTPDPLAERYPDQSPYAHCANNPVRNIDPTGLFSFENIEKQSRYPVIAIFQTGFTNPVVAHGNVEALNEAYQGAKNALVPILMVDNIQDLSDAFSALRQMSTNASVYTLTSHGLPGQFRIGNDVIDVTTDVSSLKQGLQGTSVFINACESGNNKSGNSGQYMVENFANMTNSTVIASTSEIVAGYKYDGSIVKTTDPNGQYIVSHGNFKSSSATNVRIHSALGISWAEENTSKSFDVSPLVQPTFMTP